MNLYPEAAVPDPGVPDRKETEARRMLAGLPLPPVPPDLAARALARGRRLRAHRRLRRRLGWLLALLAVAALTWTAAAQPWVPPPSRTTPPVEGW
ncbi:hypothetical protein [Streptomyces endophytica]|uniref:Uncharacterized protein n=2 Tax=Streptomyces TaxID=1883 RepID=A0ABY6P9G1_9ACTN|nr:hypothetical protein [Streptomyces endophytica]UZJ29827.1 hypothetical protein OJ254_04445 [Streptomyces endophytica]